MNKFKNNLIYESPTSINVSNFLFILGIFSKNLIQVLQKLADTGNSIVVIEHNLDVIKTCDYIIDLGPGIYLIHV